MKKVFACVLVFVLLASFCCVAESAAKVEIDWQTRYSYSELEQQMDAICAANPQLTE